MFRKAIKNGMIKTSGIAAAAMMVGLVAGENPFTLTKVVALCVCAGWITLLMVANGDR